MSESLRGGVMGIINEKYRSLVGFSEEFRNAKPFPYLVMDDFLDKDFFVQLSEIHDSGEMSTGKIFNTELEKKKWISLNANLPELLLKLIEELNSDVWVENLKNFTGIPSLVATQFGNTKLANYHQMTSTGFLAPHVDHSSEPETGLPHVLNIITYLSPQWEKEYGGATLFYDKSGKKVVSTVEYKPNRAVIFLHTPYSFHCVDRLADSLIASRKSLYVDYYSQSFDPYKSFNLLFPNRWFKHGTTFILPRVFDYFFPKNKRYIKAYIQYLINRGMR